MLEHIYQWENKHNNKTNYLEWWGDLTIHDAFSEIIKV